MTSEYSPRRRGQTIRRRVAKNVALCTMPAAAGLGAVILGNPMRPDHNHALIGLVTFVVGGAVFDTSILLMAMNILIAWKNPKEFAGMFKKAAKPPQQLQLPF